MSLEFLRRNDASLAKDVSRLVDKAIAKNGVPVSVAQVNELVDAIYPRVVHLRKAAWRAHMVDLGRQAAAAGVVLTPEPLAPYPRKALFDAISKVSRVAPDSPKLHVEILDEASKKRVLQAVTPDYSNRGSAAVKARVASELSRRVSRHVVAAGRDAVADTVHNGSAKFAGSGVPARAGYARVLSGRESCAFCAMLASRGAVYSDDTVVTRKDGRRYHDGCDCVPVLVVDGVPWEGQAEAEALYSRWRELTWENGQIASNQFKKWQQAISAGELDAKLYSPFYSSAESGAARVVSLLDLGKEKARGYLHSKYGVVGVFGKEELQGLYWYTGSGHDDINRFARKHKDDWNKQLDLVSGGQRREVKLVVDSIESIDSVMARAKSIEEPVEVVRRIRIEELEGSAIGKGFNAEKKATWLSTEFKSWGYMSTSTHSVPGFGPIEMRLTVPKGTKAVYLGWDGNGDKSTALSNYPEEEELLLGRQIRYRIKDISNESDTTVVHAEVIGQDV